MSQPSITFTRIAELYVQELRQGGMPQVEEYIRAFPHLADDIQEHFPTLHLIESVPKKIDLRPGDVLGNCTIGNEIGRGGMGIVYRGRDNANQRDVAVKVLPLQMAGKQYSARFQHEREAMSRLNHPNILPVYAHGCTADFAYLVIKLIEGHNLSQLLKNVAGYRSAYVLAHWRSDWAALATMAAQLASGVQHAHDNGLVHRDIKPANLLLDNEGRVWISDFGLAKLWDSPHSVSMTGDVIGTPRYMAPEQCQGICDARSDVYSLGITLYELASGQRASQGETFDSIVRNRAITIRDIREVADVPEELAKIIMRASQYDPANRYQTAREMQHVLERFALGCTRADRRDIKRPSNEVYKQRLRKHIRLASIAGGCICLMAFGMPWMLRSGRGDGNSLSANSTARTMRELQVPTQEFVDQLAVRNQEEFVQGVFEAFEESINRHSTVQWNFTEKGKQDLLQRNKDIKQMFLERRLTPADMNKFMAIYRASALAVAGRILLLISQIDQNFPEKSQRLIAFDSMRQLSSAIVNGAVSKSDASRHIEGLIRGRFNSIEESVAVRLPAEEVTQWLIRTQLILSRIPPEKRQPHSTVPKELDQMLYQAFGVTPPSRQ